MSVPSFSSLSMCLKSVLPNALKFRRDKGMMFAGYSSHPSYLVEKNGKITPGGIALLARFAKRGMIKVKDEKKAMMFLYGRDLFKDSYKVIKRSCREGYVLVYWNGILLGLARLYKGMALNVIDFGEYLRRGY